MAQKFFARLSGAPPPAEVWDDEPHHAPVMAHGSRRAMVVSLAMFGVSALLIIGYVGYHNWVMPAPVELGASLAIDLPQPTTTLPEPAPVSAPSAHVAPVQVEPVQVEPVQVEPAQVELGQAELGQAAAAQNEPAQTPSGATTLAAGDPSAQPTYAGPNYDEFVETGDVLARRGQRKEALDAYQRALALRPDGSHALARIASMKLGDGDPTGARDHAERAVATDPENAEAFVLLGAALEALGDEVSAQAVYQRCVQSGRGSLVSECVRRAR